MPLDVYDHNDGSDTAGDGDSARRRPYICMLFECCGVYVRIYRSPEDACYRGRCPKCLRTINVRVAPDGTPNRFFHAS